MTAAAAAGAKMDGYRPYSTKSTEIDLPEHSALENLFERRLSAERRQQLLDARKSSRRRPSVRSHVASNTRVGSDTQSGQQDPQIQRQMDELDRHRQTVQKMSDKIIDLHSKMTQLEKQNGDLRRQLDTQLYASKPAVDHDNPDKLSRDELVRRYTIVKNKLHRQAATVAEYKQKVVELQKKLIEKNELEKEYIKKEDSFQSQTDLIQRLQEKTKRFDGLEGVYKKQEHVIRKLERLVNRHDNGNDVEELLELRQRQQAAQQRIQALEKQLAENSRRWSRQKTEMSLQLQEAKYGLIRPSTSHRLSPIPSLSAVRRDVKPAQQQQQPHSSHYRHRSSHSSTQFL